MGLHVGLHVAAEGESFAADAAPVRFLALNNKQDHMICLHIIFKLRQFVNGST